MEILTSMLERIAWSGDASFYRAVPQAVAFPSSVEDIQELLAQSRKSRVPLTFRASGTSLSGQAIGEGVLVSVTRAWQRCEILEQGRLVRVEPGVIGARVNRALDPLGRKLGPDPASMDAARMGGIIANNSSGMCCGVARTAYRTLRAMRFVLASGLLIDTSDPRAGELLREKEPELERELRAIRGEILASPELCERIRSKYRIKNTMGYALNAFLDYEDPVGILAHLLIGSEGTLGFIAEATLETVPSSRFKATALLTFDSVESACLRVPEIERAGAEAIELLDRAALRSVESQPGAPSRIMSLPEDSAALVVEFQFASESERAARVPELRALLHAPLETDRLRQEEIWKVRKGVFPSIAASRPSGGVNGRSVIIEDVAVPRERLASAVLDLRRILDRNGYEDGVIFGHAKDGNLHFVVTQSFGAEEQLRRYARMMEELASCIIQLHGGSLKAEHGTGRNMAPFLELEWGKQACGLMRRIKRAVDPLGILNPGVILNEDPRAHLENIKTLPPIDPETDRCTECGFCEPRCPSADLTLTPRQRIAIRREMARSSREPETLAELGRAFQHAGIDTCAADGSCALACPVGIDTGVLIKRLRSEAHSPLALATAGFVARAFWMVESAAFLLVGLALVLRKWIGDRGLQRLARRWHPRFARTTALPRSGSSAKADYVYFPSCVNRVIGANLPVTVVEVAKRAGKRAWIPPDARGNCCGTPFASKGFENAREHASARTLRRMWKWSRHGAVPVIVDQSPCACALKEALDRQGSRYPGLRILDSAEAARELVASLRIRRKCGSVILHPVCSTEKMKLGAVMESVARSCAEEVYVPSSSRCCGFAGDLGLRVPELPASATRAIARELEQRFGQRGGLSCFSTSTTCELALTQATGQSYRSIWHLLEEASR